MPNRSNEDELRSVCPLQILNRKNTELFWDQHTGQMADSVQRDVSEWENCSEISPQCPSVVLTPSGVMFKQATVTEERTLKPLDFHLRDGDFPLLPGSSFFHASHFHDGRRSSHRASSVWTFAGEPSAPVSAAEPSAPVSAAEPSTPTMKFGRNVFPLVSSPKTVFPPCLPLPPPPICVHTATPSQAPLSSTPPRSSVPLPPPWLQPPSSPPWPISPPASPVSILPPVKHWSFISLPSPQDFTPPYSLHPSVPLCCWLLHSLLFSLCCLSSCFRCGLLEPCLRLGRRSRRCHHGPTDLPRCLDSKTFWLPSAPDPPWPAKAPDPPWRSTSPDPPWLMDSPWRPPLQPMPLPAPA
ncbi:hypothetical protein DPX16_22663 [Anabarilius grahami]|uniref:Uncharacterized protein n=1 Tax=Anabarilius grahami TaxID=495550 RepID=A0A3N0XJX2_ANAGA|nr:hypothetical protein DPX16_22663 [Anabarilius grahami]